MKYRFLPCVWLCALALTTPTQAASKPFSMRTLRINKRLYKAATHYPVFRNSGAVARIANATLRKFAVSQHLSFRKEAQKIVGEFKPPGNLEHELTYAPGPFSGPRLISGYFAQYQYMGGAHPMSMTFCFNFGLVKGRAKQLTLGDFFRDESTYQKRVTSALLGRLRLQQAAWIIEGTVSYFNANQLNNFVAEKDGLRFYFDPYAVGPYAAGSYEVKLTTQELGPGFHLPL